MPPIQSNTPARPDVSRSKLIQLIHVAKTQLALDDDNYRALIAQAKPTASSCTDLNLFQLGELYKLLKAAGFKPISQIPNRAPQKRQTPTAGSPEWASPSQLHYIRGLWQLASRHKSEASLNKLCTRITGIHRIEWLTQPKATKLILSLRDIARKAGFDPDSIPQKP